MSITVGLTGQSGAGKTTVSEAFRKSGFAVINCDKISREVTESGSECCKKLSEIFPHCFNDELVLDRHKMAEIVFSDKNKLQQLNNTIYPFIMADIKNRIKTLSESYNYILLDAPTLFEAGADKLCDIIVCVIADKEIRINRIAQRDKIDKELILKRFDSQKSTEFFVEHSDYAIKNNSDITALTEQTNKVIDIIKRKV